MNRLVVAARWYERLASAVGLVLEDVGDRIAMAGTAMRKASRKRVIAEIGLFGVSYRVDDRGAWSE